MTTYSPMLTAGEARNKVRQDRLIFDEIRTIESDILDSIDGGRFDVSVQNSYMTDINGMGHIVAQAYYMAWAGVEEDRSKTVQMDAVITYFQNLGYSIERRLNPEYGDTFLWYVAW